MSNNKITQELIKLFEHHRIVFWYDDKKELRNDFETLDLPDVEKIEIDNNEFGIKYRVLREQPETKFLLYHEGPKPQDKDDWLLDVLLSYRELRTDKTQLYLDEFSWDRSFITLTTEYKDFFTSAQRRESLKKLINPNPTFTEIKIAMLAVCCGDCENRIDKIIETLFEELALESNKSFELIAELKLDKFLFEQLEAIYAYKCDNRSIEDFAIELFKSSYAQQLDENAMLNTNALLLFNNWKDSIRAKTAFETLSARYCDIVREKFKELSLEKIGSFDMFEKIDLQIISQLATAVNNRSLPLHTVVRIIHDRKNTHFFDKYQHFYNALEYAVSFFEQLSQLEIHIETPEDGFRKYTQNYFKIDQLYRKFVYHYQQCSKQTDILAELLKKIENFYSNNFLLQLGDQWQQKIETQDIWEIAGIPQQKNFYKNNIDSFTNKDKRIVVIISDALRYEIGEELCRTIKYENRFNAKLSFQQATLPSYTQLGMAALLPHKELEIAENKSGIVLVDGVSSSGTENRAKILSNYTDGKATAIRVEDIKQKNRNALRDFVKQYNVIYIYHNLIDNTGDKRESEERTFSSTEETISELRSLLKKLVGANISNMIITADHGFIYQNNILDESDFAQVEDADSNILFYDRRFLIGKKLTDKNSCTKYSSEQLGLKGSLEVQIPRSINRLRRKGSGSRYVHGGATLQETVVPIIAINVKHDKDIELADVEILQGATSMITSRQFSVVFFQTDAVKDKIRPRELRAALYSTSGEKLSDVCQLCFDSESDDPRLREKTQRFVLSNSADDYSNQDVILKLEERQGSTNHYRDYKSIRYKLNLNYGFGNDFF